MPAVHAPDDVVHALHGTFAVLFHPLQHAGGVFGQGFGVLAHGRAEEHDAAEVAAYFIVQVGGDAIAHADHAAQLLFAEVHHGIRGTGYQEHEHHDEPPSEIHRSDHSDGDLQLIGPSSLSVLCLDAEHMITVGHRGEAQVGFALHVPVRINAVHAPRVADEGRLLEAQQREVHREKAVPRRQNERIPFQQWRCAVLRNVAVVLLYEHLLKDQRRHWSSGRGLHGRGMEHRDTINATEIEPTVGTACMSKAVELVGGDPIGRGEDLHLIRDRVIAHKAVVRRHPEVAEIIRVDGMDARYRHAFTLSDPTYLSLLAVPADQTLCGGGEPERTDAVGV